MENNLIVVIAEFAFVIFALGSYSLLWAIDDYKCDYSYDHFEWFLKTILCVFFGIFIFWILLIYYIKIKYFED